MHCSKANSSLLGLFPLQKTAWEGGRIIPAPKDHQEGITGGPSRIVVPVQHHFKMIVIEFVTTWWLLKKGELRRLNIVKALGNGEADVHTWLVICEFYSCFIQVCPE